jgi:hypothetical protein
MATETILSLNAFLMINLISSIARKEFNHNRLLVNNEHKLSGVFVLQDPGVVESLIISQSLFGVCH